MNAIDGLCLLAKSPLDLQWLRLHFFPFSFLWFFFNLNEIIFLLWTSFSRQYVNLSGPFFVSTQSRPILQKSRIITTLTKPSKSKVEFVSRQTPPKELLTTFRSSSPYLFSGFWFNISNQFNNHSFSILGGKKKEKRGRQSNAENSASVVFRGPTNDLQKAPPSVLADWNAYAASRDKEEAESSSSNLGFDLESAVRSANDKVSGTLNVMSRGVRSLPGSFRSATSSVPSGKSFMYFGLLLASGVFFIIIAFSIFLPVMMIAPQKFAICLTMGCAFIIGSFFALKGPKNQLAHMTSKRLPFTLGFLFSTVGTIYVSMVLHSYILSVFFSLLQVIALSYYAISYFPGGSSGLKFLSSTITSSVLRCFGR